MQLKIEMDLQMELDDISLLTYLQKKKPIKEKMSKNTIDSLLRLRARIDAAATNSKILQN
jgi:hypothetical protein